MLSSDEMQSVVLNCICSLSTLKVSVMKVERVDLSQDGLRACISGVASRPSCLTFAHFPLYIRLLTDRN